MFERNPLDHDMVIDRNGKIYTVVGNTHPLNYIIAYVKYIPTTRKTLWCDDVCYERVLKIYDVKAVIDNCKVFQECVYDHILNATIPIVRNSNVKHHLLPEKRLRHIVLNPRDPLERKVSDLFNTLTSLGIKSSSLGITGSLLARIHNVKISDIDLIVYGDREGEKYLEIVSDVGKTLPKNIIEKIIEKDLKPRGLSKKMISKVLPLFKRYLYKGTIVNTIFVSFANNKDVIPIVNVGLIKLRTKLKSYEFKALCYPSIAPIVEYEIIEGPKDINISYIISYDYFISPLLYYGGDFYVEGILQYIPTKNLYRVLIGGAEFKGVIKPLLK